MSGYTTAAANGPREPLTIEKILAAIDELKKLPVNDQWIVVDPQGLAMTGTVEQVLPRLVAAHPFFKKSMAFPYPEYRDSNTLGGQNTG